MKPENRITQSEGILIFIGLAYLVLGVLRVTGGVNIDSNLIALLTIGGGLLSFSEAANALSEDMRIKKIWAKRFFYGLSLTTMGLAVLSLIVMPFLYFSFMNGDYTIYGDGVTLVSIAIIFFSFVTKNNVVKAKLILAENLKAENGEFIETLVIPVGDNKYKKL